MNKSIFRIALTGGPCSGKTTSLVKIIERFSDRGFLVYALPETPTLYMNASVNFLTDDKNYFYNIEKSILKFQIQMENNFIELAKTANKPVIIIADRGVMDISAYMDKNMWQALLDELSLSEVMLRDARYDGVIHMVTAANGAEEFYTTENNSARHESVEMACEIDQKIINAWTGHQNLYIVENNIDFDAKIGQCLSIIASLVGDQADGRLRRKFRVHIDGDIPYGIETEIYEYNIKTDAQGKIKIRKRGTAGNYVYFMTSYTKSVEGKRVEIERPISPDEFIFYLRQADNSTPDYKKRKSFVWARQSFNVDIPIEPKSEEAILHVVTDSPESEIRFPQFIKVIEEIK